MRHNENYPGYFLPQENPRYFLSITDNNEAEKYRIDFVMSGTTEFSSEQDAPIRTALQSTRLALSSGSESEERLYNLTTTLGEYFQSQNITPESLTLAITYSDNDDQAHCAVLSIGEGGVMYSQQDGIESHLAMSRAYFKKTDEDDVAKITLYNWETYWYSQTRKQAISRLISERAIEDETEIIVYNGLPAHIQHQLREDQGNLGILELEPKTSPCCNPTPVMEKFRGEETNTFKSSRFTVIPPNPNPLEGNKSHLKINPVGASIGTGVGLEVAAVFCLCAIYAKQSAISVGLVGLIGTSALAILWPALVAVGGALIIGGLAYLAYQHRGLFTPTRQRRHSHSSDETAQLVSASSTLGL